VALLSIEDLRVFYGDFQALNGVGMTVEEGQTVSVIGANGAGKSTLLRAITGLNREKSGSITFAGRQIVSERTDRIARAGITMVPEGRRLFQTLSVEDNLIMGRSSGRAGKWTLAAVFDLFPRLKDLRHMQASRLSGGQQQMVSIGRALMTNPRLLLCDEISLGLAPKVIADIYACFDAIKTSGVSIVLIEQNVEQARAAADYVYCLLEGAISLAGAPKDLTMDQISNAYFGGAVAA
jgi:branched-chain amino acid transport system ATP-binding protein